MRTRILRLIALAACLAPAIVLAQQAATPPAPPVRDLPHPDQLEPAVDTSAPSAAAGPGVSQSADSSGSKPAPAATGPLKAAPASGAAQKDASKSAPKKAGADRLQLDATDITGNRELPKVLYIVPWKRSDLGDLLGKPPNSLLDEVLQPVDRDVFKRENRYYDALKPDPQSPQPSAPEGVPKNP
jgi:hypothetical protein